MSFILQNQQPNHLLGHIYAEQGSGFLRVSNQSTTHTMLGVTVKMRCMLLTTSPAFISCGVMHMPRVLYRAPAGVGSYSQALLNV